MDNFKIEENAEGNMNIPNENLLLSQISILTLIP